MSGGNLPLFTQSEPRRRARACFSSAPTAVILTLPYPAALTKRSCSHCVEDPAAVHADCEDPGEEELTRPAWHHSVVPSVRPRPSRTSLLWCDWAACRSASEQVRASMRRDPQRRTRYGRQQRKLLLQTSALKAVRPAHSEEEGAFDCLPLFRADQPETENSLTRLQQWCGRWSDATAACRARVASLARVWAWSAYRTLSFPRPPFFLNGRRLVVHH